LFGKKVGSPEWAHSAAVYKFGWLHNDMGVKRTRVADKSLSETLACYTEENAHHQDLAMQLGTPYSFSDQEIRMCRAKLWNDALFQWCWDHFKSKLN
jgi:hypothetical protein